MRIVAAIALLLGACTTNSDPDVRIERQSTTVADANTAAWAEGGAVLVAVPGTFSFPQPLAIRISLIDSKKLDASGAATQLTLTSATIALYGSDNEAQLVDAPTCERNFCTAGLTVAAAGQSMLTVKAVGPDGELNDCFYYGVYEDADPAAAGATHQSELEAEQADCRASFWN